jgi:hypothetical protein
MDSHLQTNNRDNKNVKNNFIMSQNKIIYKIINQFH